ncbi:MAG: asparagine synthase (glutamine-hydrolyzing) [Gammaproteobacteria bacterium]|jgi:asparagine synthase (glutamine-hydrolysing)
MCGISFIFDSELSAVNDGAINAMVDAIGHRGPDARRSVLKRHVALGHTRLSIVDIKGGHQPMESGDGRFSIIYNGELYNYHALKKNLQEQGFEFRSQSDTEVVLAMYIHHGQACLSRLRGMFSFVVHDNETGSLFIARDRMGIKPLYYTWTGGKLIGASEIKAIFASGYVEPKLNIHSIANYFKYQFSVAPYTPFENIFELEPGYLMTIEPGAEPRTERYWDLEFPENDHYESLSEDKWQQRFQDALDDAVVSHMIGEVPLGAYLSGGIDSATTTYMLNKHYDNELLSFTIAFTNEANDESEISREIAHHIHVPNDELVIDDDRPDGFLSILEDAVYYLEQPQRVAVDIPHFMLSGLVRDRHYKVVYTGDGADEILGGYDCYRQDMIRVWGNERETAEQREMFYMNEFTENFADAHMRMLLALHEPARQWETIEHYGCYPSWYDYWHVLDEVADRILLDDVKHRTQNNFQMDELVQRMKPCIENRHPLNQSLYIETKTRLPGWILWKSDRLSMAHSVEARVPFMDHKLVELTAQIPPWLKLNGMDEKYILRKIMMPHLPQHPQQFKKRAFYTPIREWFFTRDKINQLQDYVSRPALEKSGVFNVNAVQEMINEIVDFPQPESINDYYALMKLEWGLMLVLTVQILNRLFVERQAPCFRRSETNPAGN